MKGIRIIAKVDGFRRAGITHTGVAEYPLSDFSEVQLEQLRSEPNLVVQDIDLPDEEKSTGQAKPKSPAKGTGETAKE